MGSSKAVGAEGFNVGLYHRHWDLMKEDVTDVTVVLGFLNGGHMLEVVNKTIITLIKKINK